jgi:hypothetical protein
MSNRGWFAGAVCALTLGLGLLVSRGATAAIDVEVLDVSGEPLRQFPVSRSGVHTQRAYLAAERGQRYRIRVRNRSGARVGLVVTVDGRNIISGQKSNLLASEPMYVLDAWGSSSYSGWRADLDGVNEFYFTDWSDSYAEAFGDRSAKGVIAVAVYGERVREYDKRYSQRAPAAAAERAAPQSADAESNAGTGYGERIREGARTVDFDAEPRERSRVLIKYEWADVLCRKKSLGCDEDNRLWGNDRWGFAPPPPRR